MNFNYCTYFFEAKQLVEYLYGDKNIDFLRKLLEVSLITTELEVGHIDDTGTTNTATITIKECVEGHSHYLEIQTEFEHRDTPIQKCVKAELYHSNTRLDFKLDPLQEYEIEAALVVQGIPVKYVNTTIDFYISEDVIPENEIHLFLNHAIFLKIEELSTSKQASTEDFTSNKSLDESASKDGMRASS
jgi:hypothetical protein